MDELGGFIALAALAASHMIVLGFGFYRGYIQGSKDKESNHGTTAP